MVCKMDIGYKEIVSVLLITVILAIHAIKLIHCHEQAKPADLTIQTDKVSTADACLICDYHFAEDAEYIFSFILVVNQPESILYSILYKSQTIASIGLHYSDRGPPALG
jgi:hypothetical protein